MKRALVVVLVLAAAGCAQTAGNSSANLARTRQATTTANFPSQCEVAPVFSSAPKPAPTPPQIGSAEYTGWEVSDQEIALQAHCICDASVKPLFQSEYASLAAFTKDAEQRNAKIESFRFESAFSGKVGRAVLDVQQSPYGPLKALADTYYLSQCVVSLNGVFRKGRPDLERQVSNFLNSVKLIEARTESGRGESGSTSPAARLLQLKELLDKGLITQKEYEERRAEVLKSL